MSIAARRIGATVRPGRASEESGGAVTILAAFLPPAQWTKVHHEGRSGSSGVTAMPHHGNRTPDKLYVIYSPPDHGGIGRKAGISRVAAATEMRIRLRFAGDPMLPATLRPLPVCQCACADAIGIIGRRHFTLDRIRRNMRVDRNIMTGAAAKWRPG